MRYPESTRLDKNGDEFFADGNIDFGDRGAATRTQASFRKVDMGLDADADFFLQQKRKLEAAHRIEKDLEETKVAPELESLLNGSTAVKPRDVEVEKNQTNINLQFKILVIVN